MPIEDQTEEIIPTFSDYDSQEDEEYILSTETLNEDEAIHFHGKEWVNSLCQR